MLPVASLWACLDYKSVANLPIRVSQILYLTKLISEIKNENTFEDLLFESSGATEPPTTQFTLQSIYYRFG